MKNRYAMIMCVIVLFLVSCQRNTPLEKHQSYKTNILDIKGKSIPILENSIIGRADVFIVDNYLLIKDRLSVEKGFHLFDKRTLEQIASTGNLGQGPGEIISYRNASVTPSFKERVFYVFDYSQLLLYKYQVDSVIANPRYLPQKIFSMNMSEVIGDVVQQDANTFIGIGSKAISQSAFIDGVVKLDIKTGKLNSYGYQNKQISELGGKDTHSTFTMSLKHKIYVQGYRYKDLFTICNLDGTLVSDVYGELWEQEANHKLSFYNNVMVYRNHIMASYIGGNGFKYDEYKRLRGTFPQKILVFDLKGNYQKTLDFGEEILSFATDEETQRMYISFRNRDNGLAYLDLKGLVD